jgi:uncharacterized protein (TIGR02145 family)
LWRNDFGTVESAFRDKYGFSLMPGGMVLPPVFKNQATGGTTCLWASYDVSPRFAYYLYVGSDYASMSKNEKLFGCYVRCIKD